MKTVYLGFIASIVTAGGASLHYHVGNPGAAIFIGLLALIEMIFFAALHVANVIRRGY